jgi:hypothetical protein
VDVDTAQKAAEVANQAAEHGGSWIFEVWTAIGAMIAGYFGRGLLSRKSSRGEDVENVDRIVDAIRDEGGETRKLLAAMRVDLAILLDRDNHSTRERM